MLCKINWSQSIVGLIKKMGEFMKVRLSSLVVRCYAEKDHDSWFVICLDLNLYTRADTFEQARADLNELIKEYVREALNEDSEYAEYLIPRSAPLYFWVRYRLLKLLHGCHITINNARHQLFKQSLPLAPI